MENLVARRLRTVLANEIEDGMEHNLSHQLCEDKPLYLSPRQSSPTMDELCRPIHRSIVGAIPCGQYHLDKKNGFVKAELSIRNLCLDGAAFSTR